jgi:hypothetical protein
MNPISNPCPVYSHKPPQTTLQYQTGFKKNNYFSNIQTLEIIGFVYKLMDWLSEYMFCVYGIIYAYRMYVVCIIGTDLLKDIGEKERKRVVTDTFKQRSGTS